jgi:hypothetical protein
MESTPRFPQSLEIASRFPHSTQAEDDGGWKSGKPKAGFPLSHRTILSLFLKTTKTRSALSLVQGPYKHPTTQAGKIVVPEWKNT